MKKKEQTTIERVIAVISGDYLDKNSYTKLISFVSYLSDAGLSESLIVKLYCDNVYASYSQQDEIWSQTLLKPYTFYYHHKLTTLSPATLFDTKTLTFSEVPYYNEMRIMLTDEQVIQTMYETVGTFTDYRHLKRDREGLKYILERHRIIQVNQLTLQTIDFIFLLFDRAAKENMASSMSFLDLFNHYHIKTLCALEAMHITPQNHFILRTGEVIRCHG